MTFHYNARFRDPWNDFQAQRPTYVCHECGCGFEEGIGWMVFVDKKPVRMCDDCFDFLLRKQDTLARRFIDANLLWEEFLNWWWEGIEPRDKIDILKNAYERYELDKKLMESQFADEHKLWRDFATDELMGERL